MSPFVARLISVLIGYVFGLFLTGEIVAKIQKVDLRKHGSGNVGTTNSLRILGVPSGVLTLVGDLGKTVLAMVLVWAIFRNQFPDIPNFYRLLKLYAGIGVVLGHDFPVYAKFKGGKGVASSAGLLAAFSFPMFAITAVIFFSTVIISKYVSLGSILGMASLIIQAIVFGAIGSQTFMFLPEGQGYRIEAVVICITVGLLGILKHHSNIKRLIAGNENKFSFKNAGKKND